MVFVQYTFKNDEHPVTALSAHGNSSKAKNPYRRILQSTRSKLKASIHAKGTPKSLMDQMYISLGDVFQARSVGVLPRGPQDLYNARRQERLSEYTTRNDKNGSVAQLDGLWVLLERAKREESAVGGDFTFIRDCVIHPEFSVVLADDRQFKDLEHFTTNPIEFCPLQADPTFSIFDENLSLTVTTYRNLKLVNKKTGKPPVFIGPLFIHQRKNWQTYSRFGNCLVTEYPSLAAVLAIGTDGEKALSNGLKRHFRFATLLLCFIHQKKNIETELLARGVKGADKQKVMDAIFGRQDGEVMFTGLVDCESDEEFDSKLTALKVTWDQLEGQTVKLKLSFFEWFQKHKVSMDTMWLLKLMV